MKHLMRRIVRNSFWCILVTLGLCGAFSRNVMAGNVKHYTLVCGETRQLNRKNAVWFSKRPVVATVSATGLVTATGKGKATITAKANGKSYRYRITVENPVLKKTSVILDLNKKTSLKVSGTTRVFNFVSSDPTIVEVVKKKKNKVRIVARKEGTTVITASYKNCTLSCAVTVRKGSSEGQEKPQEPESGTFTLNFTTSKGVVVPIQTLTYKRSDVAKYVSSVSSYGQSAPLYTSTYGGDGLESIYAQSNNGNVNVPGVQLSEEARIGTISKACLWARAVCDSKYHGYDDGQRIETASWGIAKDGSPGTGDYCCFTLAECAYYFAGVNLLGECLGNPAAAIYPPYSTMLFEHGGVSFWGDTEPRATAPYDSVHLYPKAGFVEVTQQKNMAGSSFVYQAGDIAVSATKKHQHEQLIIQSGTAKNCQVAEACGPGAGQRKGGDQSGGELCVYDHLFKPSEVNHVYRFTGAGVILNTAGLSG